VTRFFRKFEKRIRILRRSNETRASCPGVGSRDYLEGRGFDVWGSGLYDHYYTTPPSPHPASEAGTTTRSWYLPGDKRMLIVAGEPAAAAAAAAATAALMVP
jgi:hypothetical protein